MDYWQTAMLSANTYGIDERLGYWQTAMEFTPKELTPKILIVDDEPLAIEMLKCNLEDLSVDYRAAYSAKAAINSCATEPYAAILLDVLLNDSNGFDLARKIRQQELNQKTPIIFMSGKATGYTSILQGYGAGAVDFLPKPLDIPILKSKLKIFVDLYQSQQQLIKEVQKRRSAEEQQKALEAFIAQLKNGEIDTITSGEPGKKIIRLLDQAIIDERDRLFEHLQNANQTLVSREQKLIEQTQKLEVQAKELNALNQELNDFNYMASHDLTQPLRTIIAFANFLTADIESGNTDKIQQDIQFIQQSAERTQRLIQDLLVFAHTCREAPQKEAVNLRECVDWAKEHLLEKVYEQGAVIHCGKTLPLAVGDSVQLSRVLQNLIHNSLKFHGEASPVIRIYAQASTLGEKFACIVIEDNGIGIPQDACEAIFEPFKRLGCSDREMSQGSGLGLSIVKKIIKRHGGEVSVTSQPGNTKIKLDLLCWEEAEVHSPEYIISRHLLAAEENPEVEH